MEASLSYRKQRASLWRGESSESHPSAGPPRGPLGLAGGRLPSEAHPRLWPTGGPSPFPASGGEATHPAFCFRHTCSRNLNQRLRTRAHSGRKVDTTPAPTSGGGLTVAPRSMAHHPVVAQSRPTLRPRGLQPASLVCPRDSPGQEYCDGRHFPPRGSS